MWHSGFITGGTIDLIQLKTPKISKGVNISMIVRNGFRRLIVKFFHRTSPMGVFATPILGNNERMWFIMFGSWVSVSKGKSPGLVDPEKDTLECCLEGGIRALDAWELPVSRRHLLSVRMIEPVEWLFRTRTLASQEEDSWKGSSLESGLGLETSGLETSGSALSLCFMSGEFHEWVCF